MLRICHKHLTTLLQQNPPKHIYPGSRNPDWKTCLRSEISTEGLIYQVTTTPARSDCKPSPHPVPKAPGARHFPPQGCSSRDAPGCFALVQVPVVPRQHRASSLSPSHLALLSPHARGRELRNPRNKGEDSTSRQTPGPETLQAGEVPTTAWHFVLYQGGFANSCVGSPLLETALLPAQHLGAVPAHGLSPQPMPTLGTPPWAGAGPGEPHTRGDSPRLFSRQLSKPCARAPTASKKSLPRQDPSIFLPARPRG